MDQLSLQTKNVNEKLAILKSIVLHVLRQWIEMDLPFFAKLIVFPPKLFFLVFWKREIYLSEQKKLAGKNQLSKPIEIAQLPILFISRRNKALSDKMAS